MRFIVPAIVALLLATPALAGGKVDDLIRDLGSDDFKAREAATAALAEAGPEAIPALEKAAKDADPEIRWRAEKALATIRARQGGQRDADQRAEGPQAPPPPPQLGDALERARQRLRGIEDEMQRLRPGLRELLRGFSNIDPDLNKMLEEMERRFRDLDEPRPGEPSAPRDFWSFRFKDGKWEIIGPEDPVRARIGVRTQPTPPALRAQLKLETDDGLVIEEVAAGGLAEKAGLRQWDLVLSLDGKPVVADRDLEPLLAPGEHALAIVREGQRRDLKAVTPEPPPAEKPAAPAPPPRPPAPEPPPKEELRKY